MTTARAYLRRHPRQALGDVAGLAALSVLVCVGLVLSGLL